MNSQINIVFIHKLNEVCGLEDDNLIYSLVPSIDNKPEYMRNLYSHTLDKISLVIDASLEVFANKKTGIAKSSYPYIRLKEEKENFFDTLTNTKDFLNIKDIKIGSNKSNVALAILSNIYLETFVTTIRFFLPNSSICSGHWDFWDKIDYLELIKKIHQKETVKLLSKKLLKSNVWKIKFHLDDFPEIVKRRLLKEKLLEKKLNPEAMMKAMIIRMGEMAKPLINYEVIDFSIRSFFTYLGVKQYMRVDREIKFLRLFEEEFTNILASIS